MLAYYKQVAALAWRESMARIRGGMREVIQFIVQTMVFLAILFFMPWLGEVQDEARLVLAGVGGSLLSVAMLLAIEFVKAPATLAEADRKELGRLQGALQFTNDAKSVRAEGYAIYEDWRRALPPNREAMGADWSAVGPVEKRADAFIETHFDDRCLMSYRFGMGYKVEDERPGTPAFYRRRLDAFHAILLSHSTKAEELSYQFRPQDWTGLR